MTGEFGTQAGTAFGMYREFLLAPSGFPCNAPPWGALTAVDLDTGKKRWEVPLGVFKAGDNSACCARLKLRSLVVSSPSLVVGNRLAKSAQIVDLSGVS